MDELMEGFGKYVRMFYVEVMQHDFRRDTLLSLFDICKEVVTKIELAKAISNRRLARGKDAYEKNILSQLNDPKSNPLQILEKFLIVLTLPRPSTMKKRRKRPEFLVLTDIGRWLKSQRYGDEIIFQLPNDDDLLKKIALLGERLEKCDNIEKYDSKKIYLYLTLTKTTNVRDPSIELIIRTPRDSDWGRYGCEIYGKVEEIGLTVYKEKELKRNIRKLIASWIREMMFFRYDAIDVKKIMQKLKFEFNIGHSYIEFRAEVEPVGVLKGGVR